MRNRAYRIGGLFGVAGGGGGRRTVRWAAEASTQGKGEGRKIIPILLKLTTVKVSVTSFKLLKK